jgi:hypothetical protein
MAKVTTLGYLNSTTVPATLNETANYVIDVFF